MYFKTIVFLCQQIILVKVIMATVDKVKDKKLQSAFIEKQQKYQHYHHIKLINVNILQAKKYVKFTYFSLGKAFENPKNKQKNKLML